LNYFEFFNLFKIRQKGFIGLTLGQAKKQEKGRKMKCVILFYYHQLHIL